MYEEEKQTFREMLLLSQILSEWLLKIPRKSCPPASQKFKRGQMPILPEEFLGKLLPETTYQTDPFHGKTFQV